MMVNVTQAHIDAGKAKNCCECPIALALNEQYPGKLYETEHGPYQESWWVSDRINHPDRAEHYPIPEIAKYFMFCFDVGWDTTPFTFEIGVDL